MHCAQYFCEHVHSKIHSGCNSNALVSSNTAPFDEDCVQLKLKTGPKCQWVTVRIICRTTHLDPARYRACPNRSFIECEGGAELFAASATVIGRAHSFEQIASISSTIAPSSGRSKGFPAQHPCSSDQRSSGSDKPFSRVGREGRKPFKTFAIT